MIKFDLDESKTECKDAVIWCFGHSNVIFNKFAKIQKYCKYKNFNVVKVFGSFSQNKDTEKAEFNEELVFKGNFFTNFLLKSLVFLGFECFLIKKYP